MAGYRRFIAYVYEYSQGKKGNGKGFIKVEARDGVCRMQYKLAGIYGRESAFGKVYGYVRDKGACNTVLLGTCDMAGRTVQFEYELEEENIADSGYALKNFGGVVLRMDSGEIYGSGWDDLPLDVTEIRFTEDTKNRAPEQETLPEAVRAAAVRTEKIPEEKEKEEKETKEKEKEVDKAEALKVESAEKGETEDEVTKEEAGRKEEIKKSDTEKEEVPEEIRTEIKTEIKAEAEEKLQAEEIQTKERTEVQSKENVRERNPRERQEECRLFSDNSIYDCKRVTPADCGRLAGKDRGLMNNNFLRHGYQNYGHLILGRREEDDRYILGVPGIYECQESLMAGMFGFPYFKELGGQRRGGRFGYWYRLIDTPDADE